MAGVPDRLFVTNELPPEMRPAEGIEEGVLAKPTGVVHDRDGITREILRISAPRPDHIPQLSMPLPALATNTARPAATEGGVLSYAFALLPGVQCQLTLTGKAGADHLEQLIEILSVQCRRMRAYEARPPTRHRRDEHRFDPMALSDPVLFARQYPDARPTPPAKSPVSKRPRSQPKPSSE